MPQGSSHARRAPGPRLVVVIVDENSNPFELGCTSEIFGLARPEIGYDLYRYQMCSPARRTRMRDEMFVFQATGSWDAVERAHTLIVPNRPDVETPHRPAVLGAIRRAHARRSGLGTTANLRDHIKRQTGCSPSAYRAHFGHPGGKIGAGSPGSLVGSV